MCPCGLIKPHCIKQVCEDSLKTHQLFADTVCLTMLWDYSLDCCIAWAWNFSPTWPDFALTANKISQPKHVAHISNSLLLSFSQVNFFFLPLCTAEKTCCLFTSLLLLTIRCRHCPLGTDCYRSSEFQCPKSDHMFLHKGTLTAVLLMETVPLV